MMRSKTRSFKRNARPRQGGKWLLLAGSIALIGRYLKGWNAKRSE